MRERSAATVRDPARAQDRCSRSAPTGPWSAALLLFFLALPVLSSLAADSQKDSAALEQEFGFLEAEDLEKIPLSVVSRGPAIAAGEAPAVVDVITSEEIRTSGARTLAALLAQRVGMDVSIDRVVPRGLNTSPSTAGVTLSNHRTLLLVNGRPTNGLFFGEFLAGRELPLEHIARIEIIRGPGSALYGTNAMAGVINVVTKDYADEPGPGVIAEYGSHSTRRVDGFAGAGGPDLNGNFFLRHFASGGANQIDRNDNTREYFGFARAGLGPLTLEGEGLDYAAQNPGLIGAPTFEDHTNRSRYSLGARLDRQLGERFRIAGRVYTNLYQTRIQALAGEPDRATYDERRVGEELSLTYRPADWLSVTFGGEVRQEEGEVGPGRCAAAGDSGPVFVDGCRLRQKVYAGFLEDQIALPFDLALTAGFRYDDVSISGSRVNPRFNLLWKPQPRTSFKIGYGEAFRAPSFFELRGAQQLGAGDFVIGNPELRPETVKTVESEVNHSFGRELNVRASAFYTRGSDLIGQRSSIDLLNTGICPPCGVTPDSVLAGICPVIQAIGSIGNLALTTRDSCYVNSVRVDVYGAEAAAGGLIDGLPIPGEISYGVNYTFQDTRSRSTEIPGRPDLPLAPRHKGNVLFDYRPIPAISIFSHTRVVGRQFADGIEKDPLDHTVNEDVNLLFRLARGIDLGVGIYNVLGDDRPQGLGVPREPRTVLGHVAYRFVPAPSIPGRVGPGPGPEPAALGEARSAIARARAAGADRLDLISYREAVAHLSVAEELQRRGAGRDRVMAAAELAQKSAEMAQAAAAAAKPTPELSPIAPAPTAPAPTATPAAPIVPSSKVTSSRRPVTSAGTKGVPRAAPTSAVASSPRPSPTPVPTRTAPSPTPMPVPTQSISSKRVLLLQSDSAVAVYRDTALRIVAGLSARVDLQDLHGDREQGVDAVRQTNADLIVAVGSLAATVAREEAAGRPVLFCAVLNPERYKLAGAGLGGVSFEISAADQLERLHSALPKVTRVGVIYDPLKSAGVVAAAERAAATLGLEIVKAEAKAPREVDPVFRSIRRDIDVLWIIPDSTVVTRESFELLALQAAESRIPFVAFSEAFARQGALLAMYPDPLAVGDQCAGLAAQVLRGDVTTGDIGVRAPDRYRLAVNRRVEDQLGVKIAPTLRADVEIR